MENELFEELEWMKKYKIYGFCDGRNHLYGAFYTKKDFIKAYEKKIDWESAKLEKEWREEHGRVTKEISEYPKQNPYGLFALNNEEKIFKYPKEFDSWHFWEKHLSNWKKVKFFWEDEIKTAKESKRIVEENKNLKKLFNGLYKNLKSYKEGKVGFYL